MNAITFRRSLCCATLALALAGCAGQGNSIPAAQCPAPTQSLAEYRIGTGDSLRIVVWRNEELSATVPVRPDGKVTTPLIDDMQAAGKSPTQLADDMEQVLSEYLRTPEVSVIVEQQGAANQIQVLGEVMNPQSLSYREGLSLLDVIVAVGGLGEFAAGNRANLVRQTGDRQVECRVRIADLVNGRLDENIKVYPGDVLVVPESRF
ncbi:MAG: XrtA/PEP-CTERM system exopolysaccharide export protein [Pseudomonadota bacterium]